jgi:hypothetical protein
MPDILAIEACGSLANLLDKRSRFAPSTQSLLAVCPVPWLLGPTASTDDTPRWQSTGVIRAAPISHLVVPVRDVRVFYALKNRNYENLARCHIPIRTSISCRWKPWWPRTRRKTRRCTQ